MSKHSARGAAWTRTAARIQERDGHQCVTCGAGDDLTVDHITPISLLDADDPDRYDEDNLVTLCRSCNARKGNREPRRRTWWNPDYFPNGPPH